MPPRETASEIRYHRILAKVIEEVLRRPTGRILVPELASSVGFSRFHLTRLFHRTAEETLEQFLRRVRLERAAYMLLHSDQRVYQVARDSGYRSPEAFSRAFRQAFACLPTEAKEKLDHWELHSISDLHWNADWALGRRSIEVDDQIVTLPTRHASVWRAVGDYANLADSWQRMATEFAEQLPENATFITVYLDNLWTHPVCRTMRADVGWLCGPDDSPPPGMRKIVLPSGTYAQTRFVDRDDRTDAWSYMWGRYAAAKNKGVRSISYDEYAGFPLPFEEVKTRIHVNLPSSAGG